MSGFRGPGKFNYELNRYCRTCVEIRPLDELRCHICNSHTRGHSRQQEARKKRELTIERY